MTAGYHHGMSLLRRVVVLLAPLLVAAPLRAQSVPSAQEVLTPRPVRLALDARGTSFELEVRDLPAGKAEAAIQAALIAANELIQLADPDSAFLGSLGEANRRPGKEVALDVRVYRLLVRSLQYCVWSTGAFGPTGGYLARLEKGEGLPDGVGVTELIASAACTNVRLLGEKGDRGRIVLGPNTRLDVVGLIEGEALDVAFEVLRTHGVTNAFGVFGTARRALGGGLSGAGWLVDIPGVPGTRDPYDQVWLRDQSLALLRPEFPNQPVNQRSGGRAQPYLQVVTVTERAADAQALGYCLALLGFTDGQRRLGQLNPRPSVSWLLGGGGTPLESGYRWTLLSRPSRSLEVRQ